MTQRRQNVSSGSPYEPRIGISRAVRIGSVIAVAGTAPIGPDGRTASPGDPAGQARRCFEDWEAVTAVHGRFDPAWLVEIEADAVLPSGGTDAGAAGSS